ncbi:hypothetical protein M9H77_06164 [Catharanthus roseus]|uniref:Uncharacterized protein n=1 Tax=Catharanthus roseus TaxID=4058 RepID=A0ACC0BRE4_CATRO|nr:hypothetical protein M9H77_06164 [Catharanthus roseus]
MEVSFFYTSTLVFFISIFLILKFQKRSKRTNLPPSPPSLPIIGHLHLLKTPLHRTLQFLAEKYGPIMLLRFGIRPTLIVSSPSIVEEIFTKNDLAFANRPKSIALKLLQYNYTTLGFSPYGNHWRNLRRVATVHIFSSLNIFHSSNIWTEEVRLSAKQLFANSNKQNPEKWTELNLTDLFHELVYNVMMRMAAGKRWSKSADSFKVVNTLIDTYDFIPILRWIGFGGYKYEKEMRSLQDERDKFLQDLIDEGKINRNESNSIDEGKKTVVQSLLALQEADPQYYTDEIVKGMIQIMFTAGTDISAVAMLWTMSLLLNHPEVLEKAKTEMKNQISPAGKLIDDSDLPNLPYLRSIINESLRLCPPAPLLLPHFTSEDCTINGYNVPKETTVLINTWAIHRDPNVWEEATKFKPERFEGIEVGNSDQLGFKFVTFGKGKRSCPGSFLAVRFITLTIGTLIQSFDWKRLGPELVDMQEKPGLTMHRDKPLVAFYKPCHQLPMENNP